jgi:hypothetical protein
LTGSRWNGTRKIGLARAGYAGEDSSADRGDLGYLAWGGWEHDLRGGAGEHVARHAAPRRSFPGRKAARARARKVAPAAAIAATLAAGAAAYGLTGSGGTAPGALTAAVASVPPGGYALSGGNILAHASASVKASAPHAAVTTAVVSIGTGSAAAAHTAASARSAGVGRIATMIASDMSASRQAVTALAKRAAASSAAASHPKAAPAASPTATATPATAQAKAKTTALTCDTSRGTLPANVTAIVSFLLAHGYSHNAAAGIAGNIYRESMGNPESVGTGGGGLIGWTPLPSGFVTGNNSADLQTQLAALLTYNQGWAQYVPALNAASTPAAAADIYVTDFERAGIPAAGQRESSAEAVASACGL